jgi:hypothetical protein
MKLPQGFFYLFNYSFKAGIYRNLENKENVFFRDKMKRGKWQKLKQSARGQYLVFNKKRFYLTFELWQHQEKEIYQPAAEPRQGKKVYLYPPKLQ